MITHIVFDRVLLGRLAIAAAAFSEITFRQLREASERDAAQENMLLRVGEAILAAKELIPVADREFVDEILRGADQKPSAKR